MYDVIMNVYGWDALHKMYTYALDCENIQINGLLRYRVLSVFAELYAYTHIHTYPNTLTQAYTQVHIDKYHVLSCMYNTMY